MHHLVPDFILEQYTLGNSQGRFKAASLFVDVSGFTAITETLIQHGKEGAEVLAEVMLSIFDPLVKSVYEQGGFIAGFAGDAFTALFPGEGSATCRRALATGWQIKQWMAEKPEHTTPFGTFTFAIRLGLAMGEVEWGILSSEDHQRKVYYFKGQVIEGCTQAERLASSGELVISAAVRSLLAAKSAKVTLREMADHFQVESILPGFSRTRLPKAGIHALDELSPNTSAFFPLDVLQFPQRGEFRQVVSVFLNLQGFPTPMELEDFIGPFFRLLDQYGGYCCRLDFGDKGCRLLLFWGAPLSHENDLERALNFFLDLQKTTTIPLRAGITYQMAYAGFAGASLREEYTAYSSRVNLAARLMSSATWGSVWLDEPTALKARHLFKVKPAGSHAFKGFIDPQAVFTVIGQRAAGTKQKFRTGLIGRQREMSRLLDFITPVFRGQFAGALTVFGEAGIGKSRLISELESVCRKMDSPPAWFLFQTDQVLRQSLNPFKYFLRNYFNQASAHTEARRKRNFDGKIGRLIVRTPDPTVASEIKRTRSFLGALVGLFWAGSLYEQVEPKLRQENTFAALKSLLKAESLCQPVIMQIEDIHWLDDDSRKFLGFLTRNLDGYSLAILVTTRDEPATDLFAEEARQETFDPGSLTGPDIRTLAEDVLGTSVSPALVDLLLQRTNGNPFFVEQLALFMKEQHLLQAGTQGLTAPAEGVMVPEDVGIVLAARLDRLTQAVKQVVQTAAVLGREFEVNILSQMLREDESVAVRIKQAEHEAIWFMLNEIRYVFKHALLRDAAYDMQLRSRLRELHALAGNVIEQVYAADLAPHSADLAYHFGKAQIKAKEILYLNLAGEAAVAAYANSAVLEYNQRLLSLLPRKEQVEPLLKMGNALTFMGRWDEAGDHFKRAVDLAESLHNKARTAHCRWQWGRLLVLKNQYPQALEQLNQALAVLSARGHHPESARVLFWIGNIHSRRGDHNEAHAFYEKGLGLCMEAGYEKELPALLNGLGVLAYYRNDLAEARSYWKQSVEVCRKNNMLLTMVDALHNLGITAQEQGDYRTAQALAQESDAIFRKIGSRLGLAHSLSLSGSIAWDMGNYAKSLSCWEHSLNQFREIGDQRGSSQILSMLSTLFHARGEYATALRYAQNALECVKGGDPVYQAGAWNRLGAALTDLDRLEEAAEAYTQALILHNQLNQRVMAMEDLSGMACLCLRKRDLAQAREKVEEILAYLAENTLDGAIDQFGIYLTVYRVLSADRDGRAQEILARAHALLQERAARFDDIDERQAYLTNIAAHRQILDLVNGMTTSA
jgi:class 3 adenylate cyclase/tetratricopeptide (TPR) repeat protein